MRQITREHEINGTVWQWAGHVHENHITVLTAYRPADNFDWVYLPTATLEPATDARFNQFVDRFVELAESRKART